MCFFYRLKIVDRIIFASQGDVFFLRDMDSYNASTEDSVSVAMVTTIFYQRHHTPASIKRIGHANIRQDRMLPINF